MSSINAFSKDRIDLGVYAKSSIPWVSYSDMVRTLNKPMGSFAADVLHSAVGVSGEVAELFAGVDYRNILEECGDLEFYIEAGWQAVNVPAYQVIRIACPAGEVLSRLVVAAGDYLDAAKKAWVYNKPIPPEGFHPTLDRVEGYLLTYYELMGIERSVVRHMNMRKLALRYPSGYTDAAAQARADKGGA